MTMFALSSPGPDEERQNGEQPSGSKRPLLLVLLVLMALFAYLYFFTGLIKPREEASVTPSEPVVAVKKPLPPRPGEVNKVAATAAKEKGASEVAEKPQPKDEKGGAPAAKQQAKAPEKGTESTTPQAPAKATPAPGTLAKKDTVPSEKAVAKAPAKGLEEKKAAARPAAAAAKVERKAEAVATIAKKEEPPAKTTADKKVVTPGKGAFALRFPAMAPGAALDGLINRLKKAGIGSVNSTSTTVTKPMHRLFVAEFTDHDSALTEQQKLAKVTPDAFVLGENGRYQLYAGSYGNEQRGGKERDRLLPLGVTTEMRQAEVQVKQVRLTAGSFATAEEARAAAARIGKVPAFEVVPVR